jgi:hypothetical protein
LQSLVKQIGWWSSSFQQLSAWAVDTAAPARETTTARNHMKTELAIRPERTADVGARESGMTATLTGGNDEQHKKGTTHRGLPPSLHGGKKQASVDESIGQDGSKERSGLLLVSL